VPSRRQDRARQRRAIEKAHGDRNQAIRNVCRLYSVKTVEAQLAERSDSPSIRPLSPFCWKVLFDPIARVTTLLLIVAARSSVSCPPVGLLTGASAAAHAAVFSERRSPSGMMSRMAR
jgi:hypothetical protein